MCMKFKRFFLFALEFLYRKKRSISLVFCLFFFYSVRTSPILSIHFWPIWHNMLFHLRKKRMMMKRNYDIYCSNMPKNLAALFFSILILRAEWYRKHALQVHKAQTNNTLDPFPLILPMQHTWLHRTRFT